MAQEESGKLLLLLMSLMPSSLRQLSFHTPQSLSEQDFETQVKDLQSKLISQLKGRKFEVDSILAGQQELKTHFSSHSCFIFVDNVVDRRQLDDLFPNQIPTNHTLRILVTTRDVDVRKNIPFGVNHIKLYPIDRLQEGPSFFLLKKSVDMTGKIEQFRGETQKLEQVAKLCYGIPLLLIQVGKDLKFCRKEFYYNETLKRLEESDFSTYRSKTLDEFLLCIFSLLEKDVQTAFLDICMFYSPENWDWERVCCLVGEKAMHILAERSMVRKEASGVIVHDVLKAMALKVAEQQRTRFKITIDRKKIGSESVKLSDLLEDHVDATKIEALFLRNLDTESFIHVQLGNLPSLRIFNSKHGIAVEFKEEKGQSSSFDNLCYFEISQSRQRDVIEFLFKERKSILPLKLLYLSFCDDVEEFPRNLGMIPQLRVLELKWWSRLKSVPLDIQHLQYLEVLSLYDCINVESLPEELGQLPALEVLNVARCYDLQGLPQTISELQSLKVLNMKDCKSITCLPGDIWKLGSLEKLIVESCYNLRVTTSQREWMATLKIPWPF